MKNISKFLQTKRGPLLMRSWCIWALCIANFILSYGIAIFYNRGSSPALMIIGGILTICLVVILSVPNMEPNPDEETASVE